MLYSKIEGVRGVPFIVIHGYFGMSDNWKTFAKQMVELGYEMHLLDLRNHGRSFHSEDWSYDFMTDDVVQYMDEKNLDSAIILGHSMGGKVAMKLAVDFPNRVERLIVADIAPKEYAPHHGIILEALSAVDFTVQPSRQDVDDILSSYIKDEGTKMFLMKSLYWKEPGQLAFRFNLDVFVKNEDVVGEGLVAGGSYEGETLFIRGSKSNYIQEEDLLQIHECFPKAVVETIQDAGHWLHAEKPVEFFEIVKSFLA